MRDSGFYWVLYFGRWIPAEWINVEVYQWWKIPGLSKKFYDKDLTIGDKIERPEKYK